MPPMVPTHLGGHLLRTVLDRGGSAGIAQRHRLGALRRSSQDEQCADGSKAQNFRYAHRYFLPWVIGHHARAERLAMTKPIDTTQIGAEAGDVNVRQ